MLTGPYACRLRDYHPLWSDFPDRSADDGFVTPQCFRNPGDEPRFGLCPRSLAATDGIDVSFCSSRYLDVSVPPVGRSAPMYSVHS